MVNSQRSSLFSNIRELAFMGLGLAALVLGSVGSNLADDNPDHGVLTASAMVTADTVCVPDDQPTIQAAINSLENGGTVIVAQGTYTSDGNRDIHFDGKQVRLVSKIGADLTVIDCGGSELDPYRAFCFKSSDTATVIVEGFTIRGGYAVLPGGDLGIEGGAVHINGSSPVFENCFFTDNVAHHAAVFYITGDAAPVITDCRFSGNRAWDVAGAVVVRFGATAHFENCEFDSNTGLHGGAFVCYNASPTVVDCRFTNNSAGDFGGAVFLQDNCSPVFEDCSFAGNYAGYFGGAFFVEERGVVGGETSPAITNCEFADNYAVFYGGAAFMIGPVGGEFTNCEFADNYAVFYGGAAFMIGPVGGEFTGCDFIGNAARDYSGALSFHFGAHARTSGSRFVNNAATHGGAIVCYDASPGFDFCCFIGNSASQKGGAAFLQDNSSAEFANCTFCGNAGGTGGAVFIEERGAVGGLATPAFVNCIIAFNEEDVAVANFDGEPQFTCTDIYGNVGGDWVGSIADQAGSSKNFSADPQFCDPLNGDYHISTLSPCAPGNSICGELIGALGVGCEAIQQLVYLDIKPGSCPNPLNVGHGSGRSKAVLPAAILGTGDFDVRAIDPATVSLLGVSPKRWSYEDVATPVGVSEDICACTDEGPDGYEDLTLKFDRSDIAERVGDLPVSERCVLTIRGQLKDGSRIEGSDCIRLAPGPVDLVLLGNCPNPFNPTTEISFRLPGAYDVRLEVFNVLGQKVSTLVDGPLEAGEHAVTWDGTGSAGSPVAAGIYLYRVSAGPHTATSKMVYLK